MNVQVCTECGEAWDGTYQRGACPHVRHEPDLIARLEHLRDHPTYGLKHKHNYGGVEIKHYHHVDDLTEKTHDHPVIRARYPATSCANCGEERKTKPWSGHLDNINAIRMRSSLPMWCEECMLVAQIEYVKEQSARIPELERKLASERSVHP